MTIGLAQQLFLERTGKEGTLTKGKEDRQLSQWYNAVDLAFADALLKDIERPPIETIALLAHLSAGAQQGHLCLEVDENGVRPAPHDLFDIEEMDELTLIALIKLGVDKLPPALLGQWLAKDHNRLYLHRYWQAETQFLNHLDRIEKTTPVPHLNEPLSHEELFPEQKEAIRKGLTQSVTLITGGPGTGKTFTAAHLIKSFWLALKPEQRDHVLIALAAPTGKAAANLEAYVNASMRSVQGFPSLKAQTLHALLGISRVGNRPPNHVSADLLLVDEASMIDAEMMAHLFMSVRSGARLILLGDGDQLPPVEGGSLFADLIQARDHHISVARLTHCLRTDSQGILSFAAAVRNGHFVQIADLLETTQDVSLVNWSGTLSEQREVLLQHAWPRLSSSSADLFEINRFRLLSPLRKGPWGVEQINELFFQQATKNQSPILPILITANDPHSQLFNGDIGLLLIHEGIALFSRGGELRKVDRYALPPYEFAYCLSVHKSQGSEFDTVLLLLPDGSERFGRELLYTAATRAKQHLELWTTDTTLKSTMKRHCKRHSGIVQRLAGIPTLG